MIFENVALVYKENKRNISENIKQEYLSFSNTTLINISEITRASISNKDLIITLGGDGTFVESANRIDTSMILGVNSDPKTSEGALTSFDITELHMLEDILEGNFNIIERQRADVWLNNNLLGEHSTNDIYIGAEYAFHSSRYIISYNGQTEEHRSSGVIISTGTGSAAWFKSAGGEEFSYTEKKLRFIVREPYIGKRIFMPTILKGEIHSDEKIRFESTRDYGGVLSIGFKNYDFNRGDIAEIKVSDKPLKVLERKI